MNIAHPDFFLSQIERNGTHFAYELNRDTGAMSVAFAGSLLSIADLTVTFDGFVWAICDEAYPGAVPVGSWHAVPVRVERLQSEFQRIRDFDPRTHSLSFWL